MSDDAFDREFDYVIVGAGSAGCVLADRLSADGQNNVLVLEYGGRDTSIFIRMPTAFSIPMSKPRYDWRFYSEPEPGLGGRRLHQARGKVIGGSSAINGLAYVRGSASDYDEWAEHGARGWDYASILPYYKRLEDCAYGEDDYRGVGGPMSVKNGNNMKNPLYHAFVEAGAQAGYGKTADYNGYRHEGFGRMDMTVREGVRWSASEAYLKPALSRQNLELEMHAFATRVILEGKRAVGIEYRKDGRTHRVRARGEVILSASAFNSPKLLMLSGIGPAQHLREHGIEVAHDLPGVGQNLQDHLEVLVQHRCTQPVSINPWLGPTGQALIGARWFFLKSGLGATNHFEANGYIRSRAGLKYPDLQYHFLPAAISYEGTPALKGHGFQAHLGANKPKSRGWLRLASADPEAAPEMVFNYFSEPEDLRAFRDGIRHTREIFAQPAFDPYRGEEIAPGPEVHSDDEIDAWVRANCETAYHPAGTCRMGEDDNAVVDSECRVRGIESLRVIDSSVMPTLPNGNINAPTLMIGEKGADHVLGRPLLEPSHAPSFVAPKWETNQRTGTPQRTASVNESAAAD